MQQSKVQLKRKAQASGIAVKGNIDDSCKVGKLYLEGGLVTAGGTNGLHPKAVIAKPVEESSTSSSYGVGVGPDSIPTVRLSATTQDYQAEQMPTVYGEKGTDFTADSVTGKVNTEDASGKHVKKDEVCDAELAIPVVGQNTLQRLADQVQWVEEKFKTQSDPLPVYLREETRQRVLQLARREEREHKQQTQRKVTATHHPYMHRAWDYTRGALSGVGHGIGQLAMSTLQFLSDVAVINGVGASNGYRSGPMDLDCSFWNRNCTMYPLYADDPDFNAAKKRMWEREDGLIDFGSALGNSLFDLLAVGGMSGTFAMNPWNQNDLTRTTYDVYGGDLQDDWAAALVGYERFADLSDYDKAEKLGDIVGIFGGPLWAVRGLERFSNFCRYGVSNSPVYLANVKMDEGIIGRSEVMPQIIRLTPGQMRDAPAGEYLFAITKDDELLIAHNELKNPVFVFWFDNSQNLASATRTTAHHDELAYHGSVRMAGHLRIGDDGIDANNASGHYRPTGGEEITRRVLSRHGLTIRSFKDYSPLMQALQDPPVIERRSNLPYYIYGAGNEGVNVQINPVSFWAPRRADVVKQEVMDEFLNLSRSI